MFSIRIDISNLSKIMKMIKVYLLYEKYTGKLHSLSYDKNIIDKFMMQRGDHFKLKKIKVSTEEELDNIIGYFEGPEMILRDIILNSTLDDIISVIGNGIEEVQLSHISDIIDDEMTLAYKELSNIPLRKKYMKSIEYLCSIAYYVENDDGTKDCRSRMNLLSVFMNHFSI